MQETYQQSAQDVLASLHSSPSGLTAEEATARLDRHGPNKLQEAPKATLLQRFFQQLKDPMLLILMAAAAVSAATNALSGESFTEVFIILAVVLLNAVLGVVQESKAEAAIEALQTMTAAKCKVLRGGEVVSLPAVTVSPTLDENGRVQYATDFRVAAQPLSVHSTLAMAGELFRYYSGAILGGFWQLFTGKAGMEDLSGPIGTVSAVSQAVRYGWRDVLSLMALLTINVGIFNLLPIPALDGCKLLFLAWEGLTGHPVPLRAQSFINTAGMVALLWLMILVTMQDITRFL